MSTEATSNPQSLAPVGNLKGSAAGNVLTRSKPFRKLATWAFSVCDSDKTGEVGKTELYCGLLLVHLNLAKYAGPAACYPPTRAVVDQLFDASDHNKSGGIDSVEFVKIVGVCCTQILGRIFVYYSVLILMVPWLAQKVVDYLKIKQDSYGEMAADRIIAYAFFSLTIPQIWNYIDERSQKAAAKRE